jgi:hypothetical protein
VAYITSFVSFSFLFVNIVLSLCVCFSKRHNHDSDIYTRLNYYDD